MKKNLLLTVVFILFSKLFILAQTGNFGVNNRHGFNAEIYGMEAGTSTWPEKNPKILGSCPTPVFDIVPSKFLNCNSACSDLIVRDSANLSPQGIMTPGWIFTINNIDNGVCFDARLEIWSSGVLRAAIGNNAIGTACGAGCNYLGTWATFFGSCNTGSSYLILQEKRTPSATTEIRMYYPTSNNSFSWSMKDRFSGVVAVSGTFNFSTVTSAYLTTGVQSNSTGINQGSATFTCPACPGGSWTDFQNGTAMFCPALAIPGKYGFTYTFTYGSCSKSYTDTITVSSIYNASWNSPASVCTGNSYNLNSYLSGSATSGGAWGGTNVFGNTFSPTGPGVSTITYTVAGGTACRVAETHTINVVATPTVTVNASGPTTYCAGASVNLTLTASGANTYAWSTAETTSSVTVSPVTSTVYTVVGSSLQGCTKTSTVSVSFSPNPTVSATQTNVDCLGQATGTASVTAGSGTPAYTYSWLPASAGTNASATGLIAGTYTATVTDSKGCTNSTVIPITEPASALSATVSAQSPAICGQNNGSASATASGGTAPYTYSWSPSGGSGASASNLAPNNYVVTITDNKACSQTASVTIGNSSGPNAAVSNITNPLCAGNNGTVTVTATGGNTPYTYLWTNGSSTSVLTASAGTYSVTITDASGCTATQTATLTAPAAIAASVNTTGENCGQGNGSASATVSGGTSPYTYAWTGGQSTPISSGLAAGTYSLTVTDANGCMYATSAAVNSISGPGAISIADPAVISPGNCATISAAGGVAYLWTTGSTAFSLSVCPTSTTLYCVTVTDAAGCSDTACVTVILDDGCGSAEVFLPNVFSPNNDGKNDLFRPLPLGCYRDIDFSIYNRWGNLVFSTTDVNKGWDGLHLDGKKCNEGVYVYTLKGTLITGKLVEKKGTVTIVK